MYDGKYNCEGVKACRIIVMEIFISTKWSRN